MIEHLSESLKINSSLKLIDLSYNLIESKGAKFLCESLKINSSLKNVDLSCNSLRSEGLKYLSDSFLFNSTLEEINLGSNSIGAEGIKFLSESLKINSNLKRLLLFENKSGSEGIKYISESLKSNSSLKEIDVAHNGVDKKEDFIEFYECLKSNRSLEIVSFDKVKELDVIKKIIECLHFNNSLIEINNKVFSNDINAIKNERVIYLLKCNEQWNPQNHSHLFHEIEKTFLCFLCCLKEKKKH